MGTIPAEVTVCHSCGIVVMLKKQLLFTDYVALCGPANNQPMRNATRLSYRDFKMCNCIEHISVNQEKIKIDNSPQTAPFTQPSGPSNIHSIQLPLLSPHEHTHFCPHSKAQEHEDV